MTLANFKKRIRYYFSDERVRDKSLYNSYSYNFKNIQKHFNKKQIEAMFIAFLKDNEIYKIYLTEIAFGRYKSIDNIIKRVHFSQYIFGYKVLITERQPCKYFWSRMHCRWNEHLTNLDNALKRKPKEKKKTAIERINVLEEKMKQLEKRNRELIITFKTSQ